MTSLKDESFKLESVLIATHSEKGIAFFSEMLGEAFRGQIVTTRSCGETRRALLERDFDFVIINAPLPDESGHSLARHIAAKGATQVILIVKSEHFEGVSAVCEDDGVMVIARPISRHVFWAALKLAKATQSRLKRMQVENSRLKQKIEDIRIVDRAKYILISHLNMSEQEAHRYLEKQAMDLRTAKRAVAEGIIKTYEN